MNIENIIFLWADLGAANNFVKNLLLLDNSCHMPFTTNLDRLEFFLSKIYVTDLKENMTNWLKHEYMLRQYRNHYGFNFTEDSFNGQPLNQILNENAKEILKTNKVVFTIHDFNMVKLLKKTNPMLNIYFIAPATDAGFNWQLRAYCENKGVVQMHNFTFPTDIEENKRKFIAEHGESQYVRENLINMSEIMYDQKIEWITWAKNNVKIIDLEDILNHNTNYIETLNKELNLKINSDSAKKLYDAWMELHWPLGQTDNWEYSYVLK